MGTQPKVMNIYALERYEVQVIGVQSGKQHVYRTASYEPNMILGYQAVKQAGRMRLSLSGSEDTRCKVSASGQIRLVFFPALALPCLAQHRRPERIVDALEERAQGDSGLSSLG